ncbi:putative porin [Ignavibacteria bacterium 4148-Me]|uniref:putative porin n=1 Tax=Rosettibacter primus TaxID=3111523 RepID=UPI00336BE518
MYKFIVAIIFLSSFLYSQGIDRINFSKVLTSLDNKILSEDTTLVKSDTSKIIPLNVPNLLTHSILKTIIKKDELNFTDYRYAGNFFTNIPFGFLRDLGSLGQPNEILFYGCGYNNISFLSDGITLNNRLFNTYDLYLFQSESIDSVEIITLPRGFLYNNYNNSASVNLISKYISSSKPYTRIKFYQAPNEEGMIDGIFSSNFGKRLNIFSEITNQSVNPFYRNTDYSLWLASLRISYALSNNLTLSGNYRYSKSNTQLNGGVNADSILNSFPEEQFEEVLYNNILAPVKFYNRYQKITTHNFALRLTGEFNKNSLTDFSIYYQTGLNEFRQNDTTGINFQSNAEKIFHNNEYKTIGIRLKHDLYFSAFHINFINEFENNELSTPILINNKSLNSFSSSILLTSFLPDKIAQISLYGKYLKRNEKSFIGFGGDISFIHNDKVKIYAGVSRFQKATTLFETDQSITEKKQINTVAEIKSIITINPLKINFGYFYSAALNKYIAALIQNNTLLNDYAFYFKTDNLYLQGINLSFEAKIWKIILNTNTSYYFSETNRKKQALPEFTLSGGIYYQDILFNSNLNLKIGLNYFSIGKRNDLLIDFEKSITTPYLWFISPNIRSVPQLLTNEYHSEFQVDIFIAGQIQKNAIIYFVFENLLNRKYFIVPYYPKQERGIRFGVAWEFFD